ncbi:secreted RxLR effector protein 161-like [Hibiscus syriacus]|uniref:secreted RxLR effector protein 161-like n=1 Tax=Hibiscus syriacus TaxID=106335 RepID=UPI001923824A|nr:secreted RxLR effector protein 161-like [Hibiscus syriacus]
MHKPCEGHWVAVKSILRYLARTIHYGLVFHANSSASKLVAFANADWGNNLDDRRSISRPCVFLGSNLISWSSRKQKTMARSTTETEYKSIADTVSEVVWLRTLLRNMHVKQVETTVIRSDNTSAVAISSNPVFHVKSKYVELMCFVRKKLTKKELSVSYVPEPHHLADSLTKPLSKSSFASFREKIRVTNGEALEDIREC